MPRSFQIYLTRQVQPLLRSKCVRPTAVILALLFLPPIVALAQGSPFDTGFNAIQSLFTGTIAKVASLVAIVIGGYGFAHGEPGAKKALAGVAAGTGIAVLAVTEYCRTVFRQHGDSPIDGVRYYSGQRKLGKSLVLFADRDALVLKPSEIERLVGSGKYQEWELRLRHREGWLELVERKVIRFALGP